MRVKTPQPTPLKKFSVTTKCYLTLFPRPKEIEFRRRESNPGLAGTCIKFYSRTAVHPRTVSGFGPSVGLQDLRHHSGEMLAMARNNETSRGVLRTGERVRGINSWKVYTQSSISRSELHES
ncbi:Kinetochore Mis14 [Macrophomina phaseolina MS6]|uniref:Kinetochore Mis14 n=1 Tax=Macrophomina phaseolina (strain MS6) TaxID=1126212 RepID=K2RZ51_MACPH|nr:Kinetochore Mis14 [Macrophomina phaseolina MS6]